MKTLLRVVALCLAAPAVVLLAQDKPATSPENPLSTWNRAAYARVKGILLKSAEKMPEENYSFKPVDTVRSYGQIVAHVADSQYAFCSIALGEKNPAPDIEHAVSLAHLRGLDHPGQHHRLEQVTRRFENAHIEIEIGKSLLLCAHEELARKLQHGADDAWMGDVVGANLAIHHHAACHGKVGHVFAFLDGLELPFS